MSFFHYEPDIRSFPCMGCNSLIETPQHLHRDTCHIGRSGPLWHPYHLWCIRDSGPSIQTWQHCGICHERLEREQLIDAFHWLSTVMKTPPMTSDTAYLVSPELSWRLVLVESEKKSDLPVVLQEYERAELHFRQRLEPVHRRCLEERKRLFSPEQTNDMGYEEQFSDSKAHRCSRCKLYFGRYRYSFIDKCPRCQLECS